MKSTLWSILGWIGLITGLVQTGVALFSMGDMLQSVFTGHSYFLSKYLDFLSNMGFSLNNLVASLDNIVPSSIAAACSPSCTFTNVGNAFGVWWFIEQLIIGSVQMAVFSFDIWLFKMGVLRSAVGAVGMTVGKRKGGSIQEV